MDNIDEENSVLNGRIKAYDGPDDYAFVSYSDKDLDLVLPNLAIFDELGVNIFYNDGLPEPITSFPNIAEKVKNSKILIPFLTPNVNLSSWTGKGILIAFLHKKHIIPIYLKETVLDKELQGAIEKCSSILLYDMDSEDYKRSFNNEYKIISSKIEEENKFGLIDSAKNLVSSDPKTMDANDQKDESRKTMGSGVVPGIWGATKRIFEKIFDDESEQAAMVKPKPKDDCPQIEEHPMSAEEIETMANDIYSTYGPPEILYDSVSDGFPEIRRRIEMHLRMGNKPAYLSFSYEDIDLIFEDIMIYNTRGLDFKFDTSIDFNDDNEFDSDWLKEVEHSIGNSSLFIFYASDKSVKSKKRGFELLYAVKTNLPVYFVYIEESPSIESFLQRIIRYPNITIFK